MKTLHSQPGTKKTAAKNYTSAFLNGTSAFLNGTSAFLNAGAVSLDIHAHVRDVDFGKIVSFLVDNYNDTIAVFAGNNIFDAAAHDAAWESVFAPRMAAMSVLEKNLLLAAMMGQSHIPECKWDGWQDWSEAKRVAASQELVDSVTRLYLVHAYLTRYGQKRLEPYRDALLKKVEAARFCA